MILERSGIPGENQPLRREGEVVEGSAQPKCPRLLVGLALLWHPSEPMCISQQPATLCPFSLFLGLSVCVNYQVFVSGHCHLNVLPVA